MHVDDILRGPHFFVEGYGHVRLLEIESLPGRRVCVALGSYVGEVEPDPVWVLGNVLPVREIGIVEAILSLVDQGRLVVLTDYVGGVLDVFGGFFRGGVVVDVRGGEEIAHDLALEKGRLVLLELFGELPEVADFIFLAVAGGVGVLLFPVFEELFSEFEEEPDELGVELESVALGGDDEFSREFVSRIHQKIDEYRPVIQ